MADKRASLLSDLDALVEPTSRGDPMSPLRWTCKSTHRLAVELKAKGHQVSQRTICDLLSQIVLALTHESAHQIKATIVNVRAGVEPIRGAAPQLAGSQRWYALARYIVGKILAFVPNTPIPAAAATG